MFRFKCRYTFVVVALCLGIVGRLNLTNAQSRSSLSSPDKQHCPEGSTFVKNRCRKIVCPLGEYYRGHCLQAICPAGLVWRGHKCQQPGYLTTVLEIENIVTTELHEKPIYAHRSGTNKVVNHTTSDMPTVLSTSTTTTTSMPPVHHLAPSTAKQNEEMEESCCSVRTPRICKLYGQKWICFNRRNTICDSRVCNAPVVYLKAPEIKYSHPILIMPPNPENYKNCPNGVCSTQSDVDGVTNCSGCASNQPDKCSPYCYKYICPEDKCEFIDLDLYCSYYPGQFGCIKEDGCLWNWC